jgi:hypothetical protein
MYITHRGLYRINRVLYTSLKCTISVARCIVNMFTYYCDHITSRLPVFSRRSLAAGILSKHDEMPESLARLCVKVFSSIGQDWLACGVGVRFGK